MTKPESRPFNQHTKKWLVENINRLKSVEATKKTDGWKVVMKMMQVFYDQAIVKVSREDAKYAERVEAAATIRVLVELFGWTDNAGDRLKQLSEEIERRSLEENRKDTLK